MTTLSQTQRTRPHAYADAAQPCPRGLPAAAYTSEAFHDRENAHLFPAAWTFVGFAHELPEAGDVVPVTVGRHPVFLVRHPDGGIRAFHNVCSHRCATLVTGKGNTGRRIKCPYHAWVYELDGALRAAPHFGGPRASFPDGIDPDELNLRRVRCTVWHDWIFVNVDGSAPPFTDYAAPLMRRLEGIDFARMTPIAMLDFGEVAANWKFLMENFIEPYHVQFVHRATTDQPLLDHYTIVDGACLGSAVDVSKRRTRPGGATLDVSSRYLTLFPNFVFGWYEPDQIGVHLNVPAGPGRTRQRRALYDLGDGDPSADAVEGLKTLWHKVHKEDHEICERLQAGRASPVAEAGGLLSPYWEDSVRRFQDLVLANLD